jgi:hypothetical protein
VLKLLRSFTSWQNDIDTHSVGSTRSNTTLLFTASGALYFGEGDLLDCAVFALPIGEAERSAEAAFLKLSADEDLVLRKIKGTNG